MRKPHADRPIQRHADDSAIARGPSPIQLKRTLGALPYAYQVQALSPTGGPGAVQLQEDQPHCSGGKNDPIWCQDDSDLARAYQYAHALHNMGYVTLAQGNLRRALDLFTRSRDLYAAIGLEKGVAREETMIAEVRRRMEDTTTD